MKGKGTLVLTTLILILSFSVNLELNSQINVEASNGYPVHNLDTGLNYTSIQEAINANETLDGHTIFVEEGNYSEIIYVNKSISIIGEDKHNTTISGNTAGQIIRVLADNVTITGFTIQNRNPWEGKAITLSSNCNIIQGNIIERSAEGICILSEYNTVSKNSIRSNRYGLNLVGTNYNIIHSNYISNNSIAGIFLGGSYWNTIWGNTITENTWGFRITEASNNTICQNEIADNSGGIYLIFLTSTNRFYQNNLENNENQIHFLNPYSNIWDNGFEGNCWSNYTGVDLDSDGIGDSPHILNVNNTDHYPLMGMFSSFNTSLGEYVNVISNSTIEDFTYFESNGTIKMHVSNMTTSQTHGFIRITIPHALMTEPYNITVNGVNPTYWNYTLHDNGTHRWIYFAYEHSTKEIVIVPEFPSLIMFPFFMALTLLATFIHRRRKRPKSTRLAYT